MALDLRKLANNRVMNARDVRELYAAVIGKANLAGATFTGAVTVPAGTQAGQAVNKAQLDAVGSSAAGGSAPAAARALTYQPQDGLLHVFVGDSTTNQLNASGGFFERLTTGLWGLAGLPLAGITGVVNAGNAGFTLRSFVSAAHNGSFGSGPAAGDPNWDYAGKFTGSFSVPLVDLVTIPADVFHLSFGINDCILTATGQGTAAQITAALLADLKTAVEAIHAAKPNAMIVLRTPNPILARPVPGAAFVSAALYPSWGSVVANDRTLAEVWNLGIYNAYKAASRLYSYVLLHDTRDRVFAPHDITLDAAGSGYMQDHLHPNANPGQVGIADSLVELLAPSRLRFDARRIVADNMAAARSLNPWDVYPAYCFGNPKYKLVLETTAADGGSGYLTPRTDSTTLTAAFGSASSASVWCEVVGRRCFHWTSFGLNPQGSSTQIYSVTVPTEAQAGGMHRYYLAAY